MTELIGWVAGILFAFCAAPQALKAYREGHSQGISMLTILMWFSGEVLMTYYVLAKHGLDLPLLFNYVINILFILVIGKYKFFPRIIHGTIRF